MKERLRRAALAGSTCSLVALAVSGLVYGSAPPAGAARKSLGNTGPRRVLLVSANLHEINYPDAARNDDMRLFVKYLARDLPARPDVLALQELAGPSAEAVAAILTERFGGRYRVAVGAGDPPWHQLSETRVLGDDTAILINERTMTTSGPSGHIRIGYSYENSTAGQEVRVKKHAFALVRERKGGLAIPVASVHFPKTDLFRNPRTSRRLKARWLGDVDKALARAYPGRQHSRMRVIAGDLNNPRCFRGQPACRETPSYKVATRRLHYADAIQVLNGWDNPIDFIFSRADVVNSGWDTSGKQAHPYSDHPYRWALLERRDTTAPTSPGRIRKRKGSHKRVMIARWDRARDGGSGLSHYIVKRSRKSRSKGFHVVGRSRDRVFMDHKVRAGHRYWYRVVAIDRSGNRSRMSRAAVVRAGTRPREKSGDKTPASSDKPQTELDLPPGNAWDLPRTAWDLPPRTAWGLPPRPEWNPPQATAWGLPSKTAWGLPPKTAWGLPPKTAWDVSPRTEWHIRPQTEWNIRPGRPAR